MARPTRVSSSAGSSYATSWAGDTATHKRRPGLLRGDSVATHARVPPACGRVTSKASEKSVESPAAGSIWHDFARILAAQCPPGIYGPVQRAFTKISSSGVRGVLLLLARGTPVSAARCARPQTPPVFGFDGPSAPLPAKGLGKGRAPARCLFSGKSCQLSERIRIGGSSSCSLWHSLAQSKNAAALAGGRGRAQRTFPQCRCASTAPEVAPACSGSGGIQSRLPGSSSTASRSLPRSSGNATSKMSVSPQCRAFVPSASSLSKGRR